MRTCLWACPLTPTPQPHHPSPCLCKINMRGSSKVAWIDAIRTTRYPLILMLCCDVFIFVVKQGVPSDEDLEWPYPSCLLYGKIFLELFPRSQSRHINGRSPNPFTRRWQFFLMAEKKTKRKKKKSSGRVCGRVYFCVKWCKVGLHNSVVRIGLETNSSGDVLLGKEKAPLLQ